MASSSSEIQTPINCQFCETEKLIKWKCFDCELLICDKCKDKIHLKIKGGQEHRILDIEDIGDQPEELDFTNFKCQEHSGNINCLFCKTCDILVCPVCIAKLHKMHDLVEIREEYNFRITRLRQGQGKVQRYKIKLDTDLNNLKEMKTTNHSKYSKVKEDILAQEKSLNDVLRKYAVMLIDELDHHEKAVSESTDFNVKYVNISKKYSDEKYKEVEEFIRVTDVSKFFKEVNKMERSMDVLVSVPEPKSLVRSIPFFVPGTITQSHFGILSADSSNTETNVRVTVNAVYQTKLSRVGTLCPCPDGSLWITNNSDGILQKVKSEGTYLKVITVYNVNVTAMAITNTGDLIVKVFKKDRLQQLNISNGYLSDSVYNVKPLIITSIHVTSDNKVIVGVTNNLQEGALVVIDEAGNHTNKYEHDQHNHRIFTYPRRLTTTNMGNMHVIDGSPNSDRHRVVMLGQNGDLINTYSGHEAINKTKPFRPVDLVKTARDNVIVVDMFTETLHITNNIGQLISIFKTNDIGIKCPFALAFTHTGQLYLGCTRLEDSTPNYAKVFEVKISGC
ncbi:uncharacterized protein LOC143081958 [Mytilus galloprovincialis]|uniref:uncharacterized protein LOC143081958 n=1 Tax=Mytilus galloprovincialis TaxID=29158 RepID=UPI003F7C06B2